MANVAAVKKKLKSAKGSSPLHNALRQKKTLRVGNRTDPFQDCELKYKVSTELITFLIRRRWDTVIQTKFPLRAWEMVTALEKGASCQMMAVVMPGLEKDWELLERRRTENPIERVKTLQRMQKEGISVGVNGEPFIPGYHTVKDFEGAIKLLKSHGIRRYNTYNLHMNDLVVKNLHGAGLDIEKIWYMNQDGPWRKVLIQLLDIADRHDIILGCPDFVNSGWGDRQRSNTCCGLDVKNPCTWNTHHFKLAVQNGEDPINCWDGVGDYKAGVEIIKGSAEGMYTLKDVPRAENNNKRGRLL